MADQITQDKTYHTLPTKREIAEYYDFSKLDYQIYNWARSNISMHFGLWDETVHSHRQALLNENKILAELAKIKSDDYVIDLGCGYGTTAIWLAKNIGCRVLGITISEKQVLEAKEAAQQQGVGHLTDFVLADYHNTKFPDGVFDVAIAIESLSHSSEQPNLLKEVYRILKPQGRLVIADGYFAKPKNLLSRREQEIARICFEGVHVPPLAERTEFENFLGEAGFTDIIWSDKTVFILKISKRINRLAKLFLPISKLLGQFNVRAISTSHVKAFIYQYYAWTEGLGVYGIFSAKKS